jgi:hypothetical protein
LMRRRLRDFASVYEEGEGGRLNKISTALVVAGGALVAGAGRRRVGAIAGGGMLLAGAVCKRWSTFKAGLASAEDPRQTVGPQRKRIEEGRAASSPAAA